MAKSILVVGYGPGISTAVADRFGGAGFAVGLVGRTEEKLAAGVKRLKEKHVEAASFTADAGDPAAIRAAVAKARTVLGPLTVLHWNAYGAGTESDLLTAPPAALRGVFDTSVVGLVAAVQEALPDLKKGGDGAVLVTNGAFGEINPQIDAFAASSPAWALALANGAKHKLVGLLAAKLQTEGVYVGEVMVAGTVKGTRWDSGNANLDASTIANRFWDLYQARKDVRARVA